MDEHHKILDTLVEFAAVSSAFAATSAFLAASFSLLTGEFAGTRVYLFEMALVSALVACALCFGMRLLRQPAHGEPRRIEATGVTCEEIQKITDKRHAVKSQEAHWQMNWWYAASTGAEPPSEQL